MHRFKIPEILLGCLLTIAIFATGALFAWRPDTTKASSDIADKNLSKKVENTKNPDSELAGPTWLTKDAAGFFAFISALIVGGQAVMFFIQLRYMRTGMRDTTTAATAAKESADTAKIQAEVAHHTLKTMQGTAESQLRAYVFVKEAFIRNLDGPDVAAIHVYVKNFGQTPAYNFTNAGAVKYTPFPNADFTRDPSGDQRIAVTIIPPSGESAVVVDAIKITPEVKDALKSGKRAIYAFGRIEYDDAFKKHRATNYCFIFGGDGGTRTFERDGIRLGAMAQTIGGNDTEGDG